MKISFIFFLMISIVSSAQVRTTSRIICGTENPTVKYMQDAKGFLERARAGEKTTLTTPYLLRVWVRIFADNNGANQAATVQRARESVAEMNGQYSGHNICFILAGVDVINDTYGNSGMIYDSLQQSTYKPYLAARTISGAMTVFVHKDYVQSGSSGNAYDIPNTFISVAGWAINASDVHSIFGHEIGHALGLYHTFQSWKRNNVVVWENVTRNPSAACYNCITEGDLCADTPADHPSLTNQTSSVSCFYYGGASDFCTPYSSSYIPSTNNIMSYMPWTCISTTSSALTNDQTTRMQATINDNTSGPYATVAPDNVTLIFAETYSSGLRWLAARNTITLNAVINYNNTSKTYFAANNIVLKPGVRINPSSGGMSEIRAVQVCQ